jgi:cysteinyl-tRNA synthetase
MKITDTLTGQKKEFKPLGDTVTMYVCGINPYIDSHMGHALSYIFFDVVRRYLEFRGYKVKHVENITDVEDNIINHANRLGITVKELTEKYAARHFEDMDALNNLRPHFAPKATETIPEIIEITQGLIDKGYGYAVGGNVYFRVNKVPDYGKLSKRNLHQMMAGARVEASEAKEDPMDFVLWKESKLGEPAWDSPWGKGRPGWHIECSAMSRKFLGEQIDIHGGGQDLVFPHHENEIVQTESFTGKKPFVQYWMHNGLLRMGEDKMSKSLGNLITIRDALKKYSADGIRIFILSSYYRSPLTYTEEAIESAKEGAEKLLLAVSREITIGDKGKELNAEPYRQEFIKAMDDDFNTPQALAVLFNLAREINQAGDFGIKIDKAQSILVSLGREVLGFRLPRVINIQISDKISIRDTVDVTIIPGKLISPETIPDTIKALVIRLIEERVECRQEKKWQRADEIRKKLAELGVILEDSKTGTTAIYKLVPSQEALANLIKELDITLENKS